MRKNRSGFLRVNTLVSAIPLVAAALYVFGLSFYSGFTQFFGIEETLFPVSVERMVFNGFFALMDRSSAYFIQFIVVAEVAGVVSFVFLAIAASSRVRRFFEAKGTALLKKEETGGGEPPGMLKAVWKWPLYVMCSSLAVVLVVLGFMATAYLANQSGRQTAAYLLAEIKDKQHLIDLYLSGSSKPMVASSILCGESHCAFLIGNDCVTYKKDLIEKMVAHNAYGGASAVVPR